MGLQKKFIIAYFLIVALILGMLSLSQHASDKLRGNSIAFLAPVWEKLLSFKYKLLHPSQPIPFSSLSMAEEKQRLQLENQLLLTELTYLQKQIIEQNLLSAQIADIAPYLPEESHLLFIEYQKSIQKILKTMKIRVKGLPARVLFRSHNPKNSSLWINVGESSNQAGEEKVVGVNSPVVIGNAIIGTIDFVGTHQSRVCLITDHRLSLSVRAARGGEQEAVASDHIDYLLQFIEHNKTAQLSKEENGEITKLLTKVKKSLRPHKKSWYLAKGELFGSSYNHGEKKNCLKGTGFNYDFSDEEGEGRDLRSGKPLLHPQRPAIPILKVNDILVTTGMDGVFPPGFQVARVSQVGLLKEGDYFYDIEAEPIAPVLEELSLVNVLPPISLEKRMIINSI